MVKKILLLSICLILLLGTCAYAQREMPGGMQPPQGMQPPEGMQPPQGMQPPEGMQPPQGMQPPKGMQQPQTNTDGAQTKNAQPETAPDTTEQPQQTTEQPGPPDMNFGGGMPGGFGWNNTRTEESEPTTFTGFVKEYQTPIISVILLLLAFVFVKLYKRKNF